MKSREKRDLEVQAKYGVRFLKYWYDETTGKVFCLSEAPSKDAAMAVHIILLAQVLEDVRDEWPTQPEPRGDFACTAPFAFVVQIAQNQEGVIDLAIEQRHTASPLCYLHDTSRPRRYQDRTAANALRKCSRFT